MRTKKITLPLVLALAGAAFAANNNPTIAYYPFVKENVEMPQLMQNAYAYAPATVYYNGQYHQFYCSSGNMSDKYFQVPARGLYRLQESWDHVRYRSSKNGSDWSSPKIAIMQSPQESSDEPSLYHTPQYEALWKEKEAGLRDSFYFPTKAENCACDPAIVNGDDGFWYMLYAGNIDYYNTVVYLARSKNIQGPYEKYSYRKGEDGDYWDRWTTRPKPVLRKYTGHAANDNSVYGIGQPTIVKKDGKFHVWFAEMNNSFQDGTFKYSRRYHVEVNRLEELGSVNLDNPSISKIKIDTLRRYERNMDGDRVKKWPMVDFGEVRWTGSQYEMWILNKYMKEKTSIKKYTSDNAIDWVMDYTYSEGPYNFIHNIGVSGDLHGWVHNDQYLLSFSGPDISLSISGDSLLKMGYKSIDVPNGIWPMWQKLNGMEWSVYNISYTEENTFDVKYQNHPKMKFFVGDFDGDGAEELGAVDTSSSLWYLGSSRNTANKKSPMWEWSDSSLSTKGKHKIVIGDYDGDGITDIGVVTYKSKNGVWSGYWNVHSSINGSIGVPHIPQNWKWNGLREDLVLLNGDYDGDGVVDLGAFYTDSLKWFMISSMDGAFMNFRKITKTQNTPSVDLFGFIPSAINANNVVPLVGDFDGDHIADMTTVDVEKNQWYIQSSQTGNPVSVRYKCGVDSDHEMTYWPLQMNIQMYPDVSAYPAALRGCPVSTSSGSYSPNNKFLAGDFDGDGVDDQMMIIMSSGRASVRLSKSYNPGENHMSRLNPPRMISFPKIKNLSSKEILVGDFDGNGYSDICVVDLKTYKYYIYFFSSETLFDLAGTGIKKSVTRQMKFAHPAAGSLRKESPRVQEEKQEPVPAQKVRNIAVRVQDMLLNVSNLFDGDDVVVMDVRGKEIARKTAHGAEVNIAIPARGAYIVHVGKTNRLISVK